MSDSNEIPEEIVNKKKLGDKKFHSETSLQHYDEDSDGIEMPRNDPGVLNTSLNGANQDVNPGRRRTMSQPGPVSGSLMTASAARAARKRPQRSVVYADDNEQMSRVVLGRQDSGAATPIGERGSATPNGTLKNGDIKSLNSYRIYSSANELRGVGTPRRRSVATMDAQSLRSVETHAPPPTSPEDNKILTQKYLTLVISCIYAIVLVSVGFIVYISNAVLRTNIATYFSIALCGIGMVYHIYLIIDIGRYKTKALKNQKTKSIHDEKIAAYFRQQEEEYNNNNGTNFNNNNNTNYNNNNSTNYNNNNSTNYNNNNSTNYNNNNSTNYNSNNSAAGDRTPIRSFVPLPQPTLIPLKHEYCFSYGRHSGSFYLKLGAAGFAIGHLIHSVLLIAMQVTQLVDETVENDECVSIEQIVLDILSPTYSFLQLYFIFKYSNVIIKKYPSLAFLAIMHIIGSSLCFWLSAIVRETMLALTLYANTVYGNSTTSDEYNRFLDISGLYNQHCTGNTSYTSFMNISENFSPYLYPFSVEFNILIVAIYYIIWSQVGKCANDEDSHDSEVNTNSEDNGTVCRIPTAHEENDFTSNLVIHADCHASNRGMFLGMILIVIVAGMLIIGYIFSSVDGEYSQIGYVLNDCTMLALHSILLISAVIAFNQTRRLDINEHPISLLDDVLLFICIPAFALETVLSLLATISLTNIIKIVNYVVMALQVLVQTPLIMDGLRRCSNQKKLRRKKPGREVLMFLIIANVAMWLFYTFSYKSPESLDERYAYYGKILWSILGHISLPLIMFYRFHSSVCFADIWDSAYKPGSEH